MLRFALVVGLLLSWVKAAPVGELVKRESGGVISELVTRESSDAITIGDLAQTGKTILLSNDDGWQSLNIRATYRALTDAGYQVILSAPASQRSGWGGRFTIPRLQTMRYGGEFHYPPAGSPSWGHEDNDTNIWYFDGTPASSVAFGLTYVIPKYFNNVAVDLVVTGPNEGVNLSPGLFTLSGTMGAAYNAAYRDLPAIAFSGSNGRNAFFRDYENRRDDPLLPANIYGKKVVELVDQLFKAQQQGQRLLPITTGLNVNFPRVGDDDRSCTDPQWTFSRLSGSDSTTPDLIYDEATNSFHGKSNSYEALTEKIFGDPDLPSESYVLRNTHCHIAVSVFSIDYDASSDQASTVKLALGF